MSRLMIVEVPSYSCEFKGIRKICELVRCGECKHWEKNGLSQTRYMNECTDYSHYEPKKDCDTCKHDLWHTPRMCGKCVRQEDGTPSMYEPKTEPQKLKGGEDVHEFCKRCGESKARTIDGERYIVCEKALDRVCVSMKECPVGKWVCEDTYIVVPQTDSLKYHTDTTHFGKVKGKSITTNKVEDEYYNDCDRYVVTNDEGERAYNCIGCQTDCAWGKGEDMSAWKEWQLAVKNGYISECRRDEIHDRITYCDVNECEDCPRMGDDCDGREDDERD